MVNLPQNDYTLDMHQRFKDITHFSEKTTIQLIYKTYLYKTTKKRENVFKVEEI